MTDNYVTPAELAEMLDEGWTIRRFETREDEGRILVLLHHATLTAGQGIDQVVGVETFRSLRI